MKTPSSRFPVLVFALLSTAGLAAQKGDPGANLRVSVTVAPICTIAVRPDDDAAGHGIELRCRNFAATQPAPLVTRAGTGTMGDRLAVLRDDRLDVILINF